MIAVKKIGGDLNKSGIIKALKEHNSHEAIRFISEDSNCLNDFNPTDGASAAMIIVQLGQNTIFDSMMDNAQSIDFTHRDINGRDLLDCAFQSGDNEVTKRVIEAFRRWAPHLVNNWPEP